MMQVLYVLFMYFFQWDESGTLDKELEYSKSYIKKGYLP